MLTTLLSSSLAKLVFVAAGGVGNDLKVPKDFATIQEAVNAALPNDTITISKGTYTEFVIAENKTDLTIVGKGKPTITGDFPDQGLLKINNCTNLVVTGLTFKDAKADAIRVSRSTNVTLSKLAIENASASGIVIDACARVLIEKSTIKNSGSDAITLGDSDSVNVMILKNKVQKCEGVGASLRGSHHTLDKNQFTEISNNGIVFEDSTCQAITLTKNKVKKCKGNAITVRGQNHVFDSNQISDNEGDGIRMDSVDVNSGHVIHKNKFARLAGMGVRVEGSNCTVRENHFLLTEDDGIDVHGTQHLIEKNSVVKAGDDGIELLGDASSCTVLKNKVVKPAGAGFDVHGNDNTFDGNTANAAGEDGFEMKGSGNNVVNNKATGSKLFDLEDTNATPVNTYTNNTFKKVSIPN